MILDFTLTRPFKRDNTLAVSWLFSHLCQTESQRAATPAWQSMKGFAVHARWAMWIWRYRHPRRQLFPQGFESLHSSTQAQHNWFNASFCPSLSAEHVGPSCTLVPLLATLNSQPPTAHSFLSVVLQPRREKKQVLLNRQAEQVDREAVPETRVTQRLWSHKQRCSYFPIPPSDL